MQIKKQYIYWCDLDCNNHYVADLIQEIDPPNIYYTIKYRDRVEELENYRGFSRISGCPYEKRKEFRYVNKKPWFIKERLPSPKRPDLPELLKKWGLKVYDMWEALRVTHGVHFNDRFFVDDSYPVSNYKNKFFYMRAGKEWVE